MSRKNERFSVSGISQQDLAPIAFIVFFMLGAVLITLAKLYEFHVALVVAIPVIVILGYAFLSWFLPRLELRRDQIGDNLYYMGFLLTLVSLSVTLIQYSEEANEDFIVSNFGVALVSTIVGILGRTILNQFRKDVVNIEKEIQFNLSQASLKLRGQIFSTVEDFASLHKQMEQVTKESAKSISEAHQELAKGLANSVEEIVSTLNNQVDKSTEQVYLKSDEVIKELSRSTRQLIVEVDNQKEALSSLAKATASSADLSSLKVDTTPLRVVEEALIGFTSSVDNQMTNLYKNSSIQIENFNSSTQRLNNLLEEFGSSLDARVNAMDPSVDKLAQTKISIETLLQRIDDLNLALIDDEGRK
jgi:DNA anti-recombination protein RmuC